MTSLMQRFIDSIAPDGWQDADGFHYGMRPIAAPPVSWHLRKREHAPAGGLVRTDTTPAFLASIHGPSQHTSTQRPEARGAVNEGGDAFHDHGDAA